MIAVDPPPARPPLRGTPRQIAYAGRIRDDLAVEIDEIRDRSADRLRYAILSDADARGLQGIVRAADAVCRVDQADWWIAQRGRGVHSILRENAHRILAANTSGDDGSAPPRTDGTDDVHRSASA